MFIVCYDGAILDFKPPPYMPTEDSSHSFTKSLILVALIGLIGSMFVGSFEVLYFNQLFRKKPFGMTLLVKTGFYILNIFFFSSLGTLLVFSNEMNKPLFHRQVLDLFVAEHLSNARLLMSMVYWGIAVMTALFILHVSEKFGPGVLISFLLGKYHRPKEEVRVFMFMDLKSSTTHAEKLGHIKYSQLIQDCFLDLTGIVIKNDAQIYQYVGDEVVLTWEVEKGLKNDNCINAFFDYDTAIKKKEDYYKKRYGMVPEFKAGLNLGNVTVAEVGELKKELAYHGDVLNTASRIQEQCNAHNKWVLISESVKTQLENQSVYQFEWIGNIELRGKETSVDIYEVKPGEGQDVKSV